MSKVCMIVYNECTNDARVLKEANTLTEAGYDVTIFALKIKPDVPYEESRDGFRIVRTLKEPGLLSQAIGLFRGGLHKISGKKKPQAASSQMKESSSSVGSSRPKKQGHLASFLKLGSRWSTLTRFWKRMYVRVMETGTFDIIHAHDLNTLPVAERIARRQKAKLVYDSHEFYTDRNRSYRTYGWYLNRVKNTERTLIKKCDLVITVGYYIARELEKMYNIPEVKVLLNAPAPISEEDRSNEASSLRKELGIPENKKIVLYVGGITFNRGLEDMLNALPQLNDVVMVFMGYGKEAYKNRLSAIAKKNKVEDRFHFFGPVDSSRVAEYASSADIGVAPINNVCLSYYFCSPNKLFEYMQAGLPVASTDFPELRKYVTELEIGRTFQEDPDDIAKVLNEMLSNPEDLQRFAANSRKEAQNFNWNVESGKLVDYYKELNEDIGQTD